MKNFKDHPITTIIGLLFVIVGIALIFMYLLLDLKREIHLWQIAIILFSGALLSISEDDFKDVLKTFFTLGINKIVGKKE